MRTKTQQRFLWSMAVLCIFALDQWSKCAIVTHIPLGSVIQITHYFDLVHLHNMGAAFSLFDSGAFWQRWGLTLLACGVVIYLVIWTFQKKNAACIQYAASAMICGGAIGNAVDRIQSGYVIDFLALHIDRWYWPAFNIADTAICIGAFCFILSTRKLSR